MCGVAVQAVVSSQLQMNLFLTLPIFSAFVCHDVPNDVGGLGRDGSGDASLFESRFHDQINTQEVKHERFLISTRQNNVRIFGIRCL